MKAYKVPSTGSVFLLPESLDDISFGQYLQLLALKERDPLRVLELLVGNVDELRQCHAGIITQLYEKVRFLDDLVSLLYADVPKLIGGVNTNLLLVSVDETSIGHYAKVEDWIRQLIDEGAENSFVTWLLPVMAAYLGPMRLNRPHAEFWSIVDPSQQPGAGIEVSRTEPFIESVVGLPCTLAVPVAHALYNRYLNPQPTGQVISYSTDDSPMRVQGIKIRGWFRRKRYQLRKLFLLQTT